LSTCLAKGNEGDGEQIQQHHSHTSGHLAELKQLRGFEFTGTNQATVIGIFGMHSGVNVGHDLKRTGKKGHEAELAGHENWDLERNRTFDSDSILRASTLTMISVRAEVWSRDLSVTFHLALVLRLTALLDSACSPEANFTTTVQQAR
jgi:hypothetical protein